MISTLIGMHDGAFKKSGNEFSKVQNRPFRCQLQEAFSTASMNLGKKKGPVLLMRQSQALYACEPMPRARPLGAHSHWGMDDVAVWPSDLHGHGALDHNGVVGSQSAFSPIAIPADCGQSSQRGILGLLDWVAPARAQ